MNHSYGYKASQPQPDYPQVEPQKDTALRSLQVPAALSSLEEQIAIASEILERLGGRLAPVFARLPAIEVPEADGAGLCEVAMRLHQQGLRLACLNQYLEQMFIALEI